MSWSAYVACFFAGMFLANAVPHLVQGTSGNRFPTPFAKPSGRGYSSPVVNTVWGLANLIVGVILFRIGRVASWDRAAVVAFFFGAGLLSVMSSAHFAKRETA